jgi:hypothetical protein
MPTMQHVGYSVGRLSCHGSLAICALLTDSAGTPLLLICLALSTRCSHNGAMTFHKLKKRDKERSRAS